MRFPALQPSDRPTPTRTGRGVIPFVAMTLFYGGLQIGYAKVQPDHPVKRSTRLKNRLNITVVDPFVGNCKFAMQAETIKPFLKPSYTWNRLVGTGQFEGSSDPATGDTPLVNSVAGEFARFVPKDFAENRVEVHDTVNNVERTDKPNFSNAISLTLNKCHVAINNPDEETLLVNVASLPLQPVKRCPIVSSGETFKWFIQNSKGETAVIEQNNLTFVESTPDVYTASVQLRVLGKTCDSSTKKINVGRVDSVEWTDTTFPLLPNPTLTFNNPTLKFKIDFSPSEPRGSVIKKKIDLSVAPRSFVQANTEVSSAGDFNTKVFDVKLLNSTGTDTDITVSITLDGEVAVRIANITVGD